MESAAGWGVVLPRADRLAGVRMAGFRDGGAGQVDVRVVPHPAVSMVFEFGAGPLVVDARSGREERGNLAVGYLHSAVRVRGRAVECVQVRLSPTVAYAVLGVSPAELDHLAVTLDDLWGRDAAQLRERLGDARSWSERFDLVESVLARRCAAGPTVDPEVAWAWSRITGSGGRVRVDGLAADLGWSRRRLWSRFRAQIGLPPKRAAKLVRFDRAVHRLAAGGDPAGTAAAGGYVDQSHLHRDVQELTGMTPGGVASEVWLAVDALAWPATGRAPSPSGAPPRGPAGP
ncbi:helix-turn-helix domain-containing protein [Pseudonocardia sp. CA-107938]|uniref:helix-turn-helix domain-containing protein n=1 Tax=Pseudonocardia sp. CA-107938 TaxID=3240021 RepID=UPI003D8B13FB